MPGAKQYRSDRFAYGGSCIFTATSGRQTNAASAVPSGHFIAPFAGTVVDFPIYVDTQFTHASSRLNFGYLADSDANLDAYDIRTLPGGATSGAGNLIGATWVTKVLTLGLMYMFELEAADTTGKYCATAVIAPS